MTLSIIQQEYNFSPIQLRGESLDSHIAIKNRQVEQYIVFFLNQPAFNEASSSGNLLVVNCKHSFFLDRVRQTNLFAFAWMDSDFRSMRTLSSVSCVVRA